MVSDEEARAKVQAYLADGGEFTPPEYKRQDGTKDWPRMWSEIEYFEENDKPKKKKKKEDEAEEVCFIQDGENLYHQTTNGFVNQNGEYFQELTIKGVKYRPIQGEELVWNGAKPPKLLLPDRLEPYLSFKELLIDTESFIQKYVDIPDDFRKITTLYVALTWFQDKLRTVPYWRVKSDYGKGKTRAWEITKNLCLNPLSASGALTSAPIFRIIQKWGLLTLAIDEADLKDGDESNDITKIINTGFERGGTVMRCDPNDTSKVNFFGTYCPKLFTMRKPFEDNATESRCLSNDMVATTRKDIPVELPRKADEEAAKLRNRFLDYRLKKWFKFEPAENPPFPENLEGRLKQIAIAFYPLFETEEERVWFNEWLVKYQQKLKVERSTSSSGIIFQTIRDYAETLEDALENADYRFVTNQTVAYALKETTKRISSETKALGFKTETRTWFTATDAEGKQKRKLAHALVITPENWAIACERYAPEIETPELPKVLTPKLIENPKNPVSGVSNVSNVSASGGLAQFLPLTNPKSETPLPYTPDTTDTHDTEKEVWLEEV